MLYRSHSLQLESLRLHSFIFRQFLKLVSWINRLFVQTLRLHSAWLFESTSLLWGSDSPHNYLLTSLIAWFYNSFVRGVSNNFLPSVMNCHKNSSGTTSKLADPVLDTTLALVWIKDSPCTFALFTTGREPHYTITGALWRKLSYVR